jgi:hypothetical protein
MCASFFYDGLFGRPDMYSAAIGFPGPLTFRLLGIPARIAENEKPRASGAFLMEG